MPSIRFKSGFVLIFCLIILWITHSLLFHISQIIILQEKQIFYTINQD
jgi:hypothetical protein